MERPVSKNEKLSLYRVFAGTAYTVRMENDQGKKIVVVEPLFASSQEDAIEQVKEIFPEEMRKTPEKFTVSQMPGAPVRRKSALHVPQDKPGATPNASEEAPHTMSI